MKKVKFTFSEDKRNDLLQALLPSDKNNQSATANNIAHLVSEEFIEKDEDFGKKVFQNNIESYEGKDSIFLAKATINEQIGKNELSLKGFNSFLYFLFDGKHTKEDIEKFNHLLTPSRDATEENIKNYNNIIQEFQEKLRDGGSSNELTETPLTLSRKWKIVEKTEISDEQLLQYLSLFNVLNASLDNPLLLPISLFIKLAPSSWKKEQKKISKDYYSNIKTLEKNTIVYLVPTETFESIDIDKKIDSLLYDIIDKSDTSEDSEYDVVKRILLKRVLLREYFYNFRYQINTLIHTCSDDKKILLHRLLALKSQKNRKYNDGRAHFKKCLELLKNNNREESSAFFYDFADFEREVAGCMSDKVVEIYENIIRDFPIKKGNFNRSARIELAIHYYQNKDNEKAFSYFKENDFEVVKHDVEKFIKIISKKILSLIKKRKSEEATIIQKFIISLSDEIKKTNEELSLRLIKELNNRIRNNNELKKIIFLQNIKDKKFDEARRTIDNMKRNSLSKIEEFLLNLDIIFAEKTNIEQASSYIKSFFNSNEYSSYDNSKTHLYIAKLYFYDNNWRNAVYYFEKSNKSEIDNNLMYAIALYELDIDKNKDKSLNIFLRYFKNNLDYNYIKFIKRFLDLCNRTKEYTLIGKFLSEKIKNIKLFDYSDYFISFLFQEQMRFTKNAEQIYQIYEDAIKFSSNKKQKAIVNSNFAKIIIKNDYLDNELAIDYFIKSIDLSYDLQTVFDLANCYYDLGDYMKGCEKYEEIISKDKSKNIVSKNIFLIRLISCYQKLKLKDKLLELEQKDIHVDFKAMINIALARCLNVEIFYKNAINYLSNKNQYILKYYSEYLNFLFSRKNNQNNQIQKLLNRAKEELNEDSFKIFNDKYQNKKNENNLIKKLRTKIRNIIRANTKLNKEFNSYIYKYSYSEEIQTLTFNYFKKFGQLEKCGIIIDRVIENQRLHTATFGKKSYDLAKQHFRGNESIHIEKAKKYINFSLKINSSTERYLYKSLILLKQGELRNHTKIIKKLTLNENQIKFYNQQATNISRIFWSNIDLMDFYSKRKFYLQKVNEVVPMLGDPNQKNKNIPKAILETIYSDMEFHKKNNYEVFNSATNRLAYYHYQIAKDYEEAYKYQKRIYKKFTYDESFLGAFFNTIAKVKDFDNGIKVCEFYLKYNKNSYLIFRHYGNFLKEIGDFKGAYFNYVNGLNRTSKKHEKAIIHNNIIILLSEAIDKGEMFLNKKDLRTITNKSINYLDLYDGKFAHIETTEKKMNTIYKFLMEE